MKELIALLNTNSTTEAIALLWQKPKIEHSELRRLEEECKKNPVLAQRIIHYLVCFNVPSFYDKIAFIVKEELIKPIV